jgi:biopolymer transport protein ExbD
MKIERRKTRSAEVYTASLNDIMFFLLLFFLIISTLVTPAAIKVALPNSKTSTEVVNKKSIQLAITADHRYFLNDKEILFEEIGPALQALVAQKKENEEINVLLQADKTLNLQDLVNVIDLGNAAKVKMVLFTQKDK